MTKLVITKDVADQEIVTEDDLDAASTSLEDFVNTGKLSEDNIAVRSLSTATLADGLGDGTLITANPPLTFVDDALTTDQFAEARAERLIGSKLANPALPLSKVNYDETYSATYSETSIGSVSISSASFAYTGYTVSINQPFQRGAYLVGLLDTQIRIASPGGTGIAASYVDICLSLSTSTNTDEACTTVGIGRRDGGVSLLAGTVILPMTNNAHFIYLLPNPEQPFFAFNDSDVGGRLRTELGEDNTLTFAIWARYRGAATSATFLPGTEGAMFVKAII